MSAPKLKVFKADNKIIRFEDVRYPMLGSIKKDGLRLLVIEGELLSATMKPYVNKNLPKYLEELIHRSKVNHTVYDAELYDHTKPFSWHTSTFRSFNARIPRTSRVELIDAMPYDLWMDKQRCAEEPFIGRLDFVREEAETIPHVVLLEQEMIHNAVDAKAQYDRALALGFEGSMLRDPHQGYKHGRATIGQNWLLKFKDFVTYDAEIVEIIEGVKLTADATELVAPTGELARSHKKEDHEPSGMMGAILVRLEDGVETKIGGWKGLTHEKRRHMLINPTEYVGQWIRFKGQRAGVKDRPRIPKDVEFREPK